MKTKLVDYLGMVMVLLIVSVPLMAHHGTGVSYDMKKVIVLKGVVTRFAFANPHSQLYFDVTDDKGNVVNWGCEGGGPGALSRRGFKKGDIKLGDKIVVDGYRAKDGRNVANARTVTMPDGRKLFGGFQTTPGAPVK